MKLAWTDDSKSPQFSLIWFSFSGILISYAELLQIFITSIQRKQDQAWRRNQYHSSIYRNCIQYFGLKQTAGLPLYFKYRHSKFVGLLGRGYQDIWWKIVDQLHPVLEGEDFLKIFDKWWLLKSSVFTNSTFIVICFKNIDWIFSDLRHVQAVETRSWLEEEQLSVIHSSIF